MITFDNVTYRYANTDHDAVRNISFTVKPGELKIVTGASGCGKTTLMRLTNGLAPQVYGGTVTGSVTVAGKTSRRHRLPNSPKTSEPFFRIRKSSFSR